MKARAGDVHTAHRECASEGVGLAGGGRGGGRITNGGIAMTTGGAPHAPPLLCPVRLPFRSRTACVSALEIPLSASPTFKHSPAPPTAKRRSLYACPKWALSCTVPCGGKYESMNSGATKSVPLLKTERTNSVRFPIIAHEKQWHGRQVAKAMSNVYPHKSLKTPNQLRTKFSYRI